MNCNPANGAGLLAAVTSFPQVKGRQSDYKTIISMRPNQTAPFVALTICLTLGRMFSSSPFCSLHSTLQVVSPAMPKLRACRGENSSLHTCKKKGPFILELNIRIANTIKSLQHLHYCLLILDCRLGTVCVKSFLLRQKKSKTKQNNTQIR